MKTYMLYKEYYNGKSEGVLYTDKSRLDVAWCQTMNDPTVRRCQVIGGDKEVHSES